ncbi:MAG TPA: hypothetical protein VE422_30300 [Terriglobia bacterium]|nr:hypothetical protein [Terriglobia bacterium]
MNETPITCRMDALTREERARRAELLTQLSSAVNQVRGLPDGFLLTLSPVPNIWMTAAEFVTLERRCCPFLSFSLEAEAEGGPMAMSITGRPGVKEFLAVELRLISP